MVNIGQKLSPEKLAFSRDFSRDLGFFYVCCMGILENLAGYTAPFQMVDAARILLKLKLWGIKTCRIGPNLRSSVAKLARANRLTKYHCYS